MPWASNEISTAQYGSGSTKDTEKNGGNTAHLHVRRRKSFYFEELMSNSVEKEEPETAILFPLDETLSKKKTFSQSSSLKPMPDKIHPVSLQLSAKGISSERQFNSKHNEFDWNRQKTIVENVIFFFFSKEWIFS